MKKNLNMLIALGAFLAITSCGTYQYAGYDNDGIYQTNGQKVVVVETDEAARSSANYYSNYFAEEARDLNEINEESEIFTDIDSYEGNFVATDTIEAPLNYGGWGQVNDQVTINIIDNGWNNWGWGWNNWGWGWNDPWARIGFGGPWGYGYGYGWPYNRWGTWNRWGYGVGGLGFNAWGRYGGPFYWGPNYYPNFGYNSGYVNYGRRGAAYAYTNSLINNRSVSDLGRRSDIRSVRNRTSATNGRYTRSNNTRTRYSNSDGRVIRNSNGTRTVRPGTGTRVRPSSGTRVRPGSGTRVRPGSGTRVRPGSGTRVRSSNGTRSTTRRSSSGTRVNRSAPSRSSSRSSGSVRSSSSSRSSGSVRSSGSSSRGSSGSRGGSSRGRGRG